MNHLAARPRPADVSVRVGWADDAPAIAQVQVRAWREEHAGTLPAEVLEGLDAEQFAAAWHACDGQAGRTPATGCWWRSSTTPSAASR